MGNYAARKSTEMLGAYISDEARSSIRETSVNIR